MRETWEFSCSNVDVQDTPMIPDFYSSGKVKQTTLVIYEICEYVDIEYVDISVKALLKKKKKKKLNYYPHYYSLFHACLVMFFWSFSSA